jgi:hypothetical protein
MRRVVRRFQNLRRQFIDLGRDAHHPIRLTLVCVYRAALRVSQPVDRQAFRFFPSQDSPVASAEVGRNFLPGIEPPVRREQYRTRGVVILCSEIILWTCQGTPVLFVKPVTVPT